MEFGRGGWGKWIDLVGELAAARTKQTDDLNSTELTPRAGITLHLLANIRDRVVREKRPRRRLVLRDLVRVEWRNLERFANKQRIRTGVGYRHSFAWRFEALYISGTARGTPWTRDLRPQTTA